MTVGRWNPAWGPEPVKVKDKPEHSHLPRLAWHVISCPRPGCRNHEGALVYAPQGGERYTCAVCGCEMRQERVKRVGHS